MLNRRLFLGSAAAVTMGARAALAADRPPFRLFDTHTHFYSSDIATYPLRSDVTAAARAKVLARPITPDFIFKAWDDAGVEMGCGVQYNTTYFTDNRYLLDVAGKYPQRIVPIVILSPTDGETPATLARMAKQNRIAGVRFAGTPDDSGHYAFLGTGADKAWQAANDLGLVVVLMPLRDPRFPDAVPRAMARIAEIADAHPNVRIVLDHIGFPEPMAEAPFGFSPAHLALAKRRNVYYKYTTYLMHLLEPGHVPLKPFLDYAVRTFGADRMMWGSDVGNTDGIYADFVKMALDSAAGLSIADQKALFHDTARRLFVPGGRGPMRG